MQTVRAAYGSAAKKVWVSRALSAIISGSPVMLLSCYHPLITYLTGVLRKACKGIFATAPFLVYLRFESKPDY